MPASGRDVGGLEVQSHPLLQDKLEASRGYVRLCLENKTESMLTPGIVIAHIWLPVNQMLASTNNMGACIDMADH